jgi:hypothetical protein
MARSTEQLRARFCALRKSGRSILPDPGTLRARRYWLSFASRRWQEESNDTGNHWGGAAFDLLGALEGADVRSYSPRGHDLCVGLPPFDPKTGEVVDAPIERQTELVLEQLKLCIEAAG